MMKDVGDDHDGPASLLGREGRSPSYTSHLPPQDHSYNGISTVQFVSEKAV
jgi:hypothetical protein